MQRSHIRLRAFVSKLSGWNRVHSVRRDLRVGWRGRGSGFGARRSGTCIPATLRSSARALEALGANLGKCSYWYHISKAWSSPYQSGSGGFEGASKVRYAPIILKARWTPSARRARVRWGDATGTDRWLVSAGNIVVAANLRTYSGRNKPLSSH